MSAGLIVGIVIAAVLVVVAAVNAAAETALTRISRARAEGLAADEHQNADAPDRQREERGQAKDQRFVGV